MDTNQFHQMLKAFQDQQRVITDLVAQLQVVPSQSQSIQPFENFDAEKEKFSNYLERFENFCSMKNVTNEQKKTQLLCVSIGSQHYNNLAAFLGPEKPLKNLEFKDIVDNFKKILMPKKNAVVSQHYFLNIFQKENQNISDFVSSLQRDIIDCAFSVTCECQKSVSVSEIFLRAQFIRGLRDNWLREHILQCENTTFDDILLKATALEASKINSKELCQNSRFSNLQTDVNKLSNSGNKTNKKNNSSPKYHSNRNQKFQKPQTIDYKALGIEN